MSQLSWQGGAGSYRLGFIDVKGRVVVEPKFQNAAAFSEGLASVKTEDGWGFIDPAGTIVISPQFDRADPFQNGLAFVTALGKESYVTTTGAFVIDPFPGTTVRDEKARIAAAAVQAALEAKTAQRSRLEQTRALKMPGVARTFEALARQARDAHWPHEDS